MKLGIYAKAALVGAVIVGILLAIWYFLSTQVGSWLNSNLKMPAAHKRLKNMIKITKTGTTTEYLLWVLGAGKAPNGDPYSLMAFGSKLNDIEGYVLITTFSAGTRVGAEFSRCGYDGMNIAVKDKAATWAQVTDGGIATGNAGYSAFSWDLKDI